MAKKPKWSIRQYNRFLKSVRGEYDVSYGQARQIYRETRLTLGRPVFAKDFSQYPDVVKKAVDVQQIEEEHIDEIIEAMQATHLEARASDKRFKFEYDAAASLQEGEAIVKVSIATKKTRKKFSVRLG